MLETIQAAGQSPLSGRFFSDMKIATHIAALFTVALWFFGGPNLGRTKMSEVVRAVDSTTGTGTVNHEVRFLPGLDFPAIGLVLALSAWAAGRFFRRQPGS